VESILAHRETIGRELELADNFDGVIGKLHAEVEAHRAACAEQAERLSVKRHEVARKIDKAIVQELAKLGIPNARFSTRIGQETIPVHSKGDGALPPDAVLRVKPRCG